mmetsp:Transcript_24450/g.57776  ORF Transcript_24450/g.57776 Transcript_24450/m.57776 type:complete len:549 (+) Transcript_24450:143-1789(+)
METVSTAETTTSLQNSTMEPRNRRKRQLTRDLPSKVYRIHYTCEHVGRYVPSTKRRIQWTFGLTNLIAAVEGKSGIDCKGEEHVVELLWSLQSDKIRVFWNKKAIAFHFREKRDAGKLDLSWESRSGERYRILAYESSSFRLTRQYDFFIDGSSVFTFPLLSELAPACAKVYPPARNDDRPTSVVVIDQSATFEDLSESSVGSDHMNEYMNETRQPLDSRLRLSMAGFVPCVPLDETGDDLISSYSLTNNTLDSLRRAITGLIPNSEDMVSRSIINALSQDNNYCNSDDLSLCSEFSSRSIGSTPHTPTEILANLLLRTTEWAKSNVLCGLRHDIREQKRLFLQKQMFAIFKHAHNEHLGVDEVVQVLLDICTLLDIHVRTFTPTERVTLIIRYPNKIELDALATILSQFESLRQIGVSSSGTFAFCRFASERGPLRAFSAADRGTLTIHGERPQLSLVQKPLMTGRPGPLARRAISINEYKSQHDDKLLKPVLTRPRSHQRNTVSIDTLIVESPVFHRFIKEVSPRDISSFDKFGKIFDSKDFSECQ